MNEWTDVDQNIRNIAEQLFSYKENKKLLELELSEEKLRKEYISKRKHLLWDEIIVRIVLIIVITLFGEMFMMYSYYPFGLFPAMLCLFADAYLFVRIIKKLVFIFVSSDIDFANRFAKKFNLDTIQQQQDDCIGKISLLETQIQKTDEMICKLKEKEKKLKAEKAERKNNFEKTEKLSEEVPSKYTSKFSLKEKTEIYEDYSVLYEDYKKEEEYLNQNIIKLEGELTTLNKQIVDIDESFENIKKNIINALVIFIIMILISKLLSGIVGGIISLVFFTVCLVTLLYGEKHWKKPILMYLLEHDSALIADYAFCHNLYPLKNKRTELIEQIEEEKKELESIRKKRLELDFD